MFRPSPAISNAARHEPPRCRQLALSTSISRSAFAVSVVFVLVLHCPRRADSAKLAQVCGSGSSGGHHPSPGDRPTSCSTRRPISLRGAATGVNFIVALRVSVPGLSMPRVTRALGTRSPPLAPDLAQCAQRRMRGLAVPCSCTSINRCSRLCCTAIEGACHCSLSRSSHSSRFARRLPHQRRARQRR
jgi:hypothetical protein